MQTLEAFFQSLSGAMFLWVFLALNVVVGFLTVAFVRVVTGEGLSIAGQCLGHRWIAIAKTEKTETRHGLVRTHGFVRQRCWVCGAEKVSTDYISDPYKGEAIGKDTIE